MSTLRDRFVQIFRPTKKMSSVLLDDISLEIRKGDRIGLIGMNGAGKTTLCRAIMGMYHLKSNERWAIKNIRAILSGASVFFPELSGRENAELLMSFFYPEVTNQAELLQSIIDFSELGDLIDTPFRTYSNGMKNRLFLSIALQKEAQFLILDEVFDGADIYFAKKAAVQVRKIIEGSEASIIVSHSLEFLKAYCNKVIIMEQGKIRYNGELDNGIKLFSELTNCAQGIF